jgi:hypothetical protein
VCGDRHKVRERAKVHALDMVIRACRTSKSIGRRDVPYTAVAAILGKRNTAVLYTSDIEYGFLG